MTTPSYDAEAEQALIASALIAPTAYDDATDVTPAMFAANAAHGLAWQAISALYDCGQPYDTVTVANWLNAHHDPPANLGANWGQWLTGLTASTGYTTANAATYARLIVDSSHRRHVITRLQDLYEGALNGQYPQTRDKLDRLADSIDGWAKTETDPYIELEAFLNIDEPDHDWLIPRLLERGDRVIITARAGTGKSTLLRQIGVMASSGLHPFTAQPIEPLNVLLLDTENSERQVRRHLRPLRQAAGDQYEPGRFHLRVYGHSINLADRATALELCRTVQQIRPDIILAGPLYKLAEGDPKDEQVAKAVADTFDQLRGIHGSALCIEAHSPYPTPGTKTKPTIRPYGASLWERWPEFGWYLDATGSTEHWRGQREERDWPQQLTRSTPWPWAPTEPEPTQELAAWDGPTHCIEAIIHYLNTHPDEELSARQLETALRATGNGYRTSTILEAAERASNKGHITSRIGPRNARLYTHTNQDEVDTSDPGF